VARKVPELCKAYTPGKPDQDIHLRLARLEHIIEVALPQFASGSGSTSKDRWSREHAQSLSPDADTGSHSQVDEDDFGSGTFQSGKWYGTSASGSVAPASVLQQVKMVHYPPYLTLTIVFSYRMLYPTLRLELRHPYSQIPQ
jgi:hypothetical protein